MARFVAFDVIFGLFDHEGANISIVLRYCLASSKGTVAASDRTCLNDNNLPKNFRYKTFIQFE